MKKTAVNILIMTIMQIALLLGNTEACAQDNIDSLTRIVSAMPNDTNKLNVLSEICSKHTNADSVLKYSQSLYTIAKAMGESKWVANAYYSLGWYYYNIAELELGLEYDYKALHLFDSIGDKYHVALCYTAAGECLNELGDHQTANEYFNKSLNILSELGKTSAMTYTLRDLGLIYMSTGLYQNAKNYINEALDIDLQDNNTRQILIDNYFLCCINCNEFESTGDTATIIKAKWHGNKTYQIAQEIENEYYICHAAQGQMEVYLNYSTIVRGSQRTLMLDSSLYYYNIAVDLAKKHGYYDGYYYNIELWKVKYLLNVKLTHQALNLLKNIEKKAQTENYNYAFIDIYNLCTKCYEALGDYDKALEYKKKHILAQNQNIDRDFTVNSVKINAKEDFERNLRKHQLDEERKSIILNVNKQHMRIVSYIIYAFLLIISIFGVIIYRNWKREHKTNIILIQQNKKFVEQRDKLADINYQTTASLLYAKGIQTAIMPSPEIINTIFGESLIIWNPMEIVSGDYYWATQVAQYKILAIADCTGHGVQGAFVSILGMTSLNDIIADENFRITDNSAAEILNLLRVKTIETLHQKDNDNATPHAMHIALCILNSQTRQMQYAGGYLPLIIARHNGLIIYQPDKMIIGYQKGIDEPFTNNIINLSENDAVYMYTNGIAKQLNDKKAIKFTSIRLNNLIEANYKKPFAEQKQIIEDTVKKWSTESRQSINQTDDQLLIGFRV